MVSDIPAGDGNVTNLFYSVLLLFSFFNPSKHHLHLMFPFLVSFFKYLFLSSFHFLSFRPNLIEFCILTNVFFIYSIYSVAGYMVPVAQATVISFSFPNSPSFGLTFLFIGVGGEGCRWAPGGLVFRKA